MVFRFGKIYYVAMVKSGLPQFASVGPFVLCIPGFSRDVFFPYICSNFALMYQGKNGLLGDRIFKIHWFAGDYF
jgi:hypothetical protein